MQFNKYNPSPEFKHLVAYYWTVKSSDEDFSVKNYRFVPDAYIDWVFHLGTPWQCDFPTLEKQIETSRFHVFGQIKKHIDLTLPENKLDVFGVKFHPWVSYKIWGLDMYYLTDTCLDLELLELPFMRILQERIYLSKTNTDRIQIVESYLKPYLNISHSKNLMQNAFSLYHDQVELNSEIGLRRLQQRFKREIGITPKLFLRTLRINAVISQLLMDTNQNLTQLAHNFNYFDQTHFIKDFKYFTGMNPSKFLKSINPKGDLFNLRVDY